MLKQMFTIGLAVFLFVSAATAQKAEVTISLNETFFDALLDSVFQNFDPLEFSIAANRLNRRDAETPSRTFDQNITSSQPFASNSASPRLSGKNVPCKEAVRILREMNGVRTAVRFRDGKIFVPLAFSGNYSAPFVGCVEFAGWAESNVDLEFDQAGQRLIGKVRVLSVNLSGFNGVGGKVIARLIQSSMDKKINPIEIIRLDKLSFGVPIRGSGNLRMKAIGARPELANGSLNIHISYEFLKG